jgi:hypothetical protein
VRPRDPHRGEPGSNSRLPADDLLLLLLDHCSFGHHLHPADHHHPPPTTTVLPPPAAAFALTQVVFGEQGYVEVTNYGGMPGDPGGHWLCKDPHEFQIPSVDLEPGESLWVAAEEGQAQQGSVGIDTEAVIPAEGQLGAFDPESGEFGLYVEQGFDDPAEAASYVEWGESGHGCSPTAIQAGIWVEGGFVAIGPDSFGIVATTTPPVGPGHWQRQVGG